MEKRRELVTHLNSSSNSKNNGPEEEEEEEEELEEIHRTLGSIPYAVARPRPSHPPPPDLQKAKLMLGGELERAT